jgi:hypothetical protein
LVYLQKAITLVDTQIEWVRRQILSELNTVNCPLNTKTSKLKWTGSIVEWVELVYSLHAVGSINDGKVTLKELFTTMGNLFDIEVTVFSNYFRNIKNKTDEKRTEFLNKLINALLQKMETSDEKPSRK